MVGRLRPPLTPGRALALHAASLLVEGLAEVPVWVGRAAWATSQRLWRLDELTSDASSALWRASVWLEEQAEVRRLPGHDNALSRLVAEHRRDLGLVDDEPLKRRP